MPKPRIGNAGLVIFVLCAMFVVTVFPIFLAVLGTVLIEQFIDTSNIVILGLIMIMISMVIIIANIFVMKNQRRVKI